MALVVPHDAAGAGGGAAGTRAGWHWPLRGAVVGAFHVTPRTPFARGQRRGIDVSAAPGAVVRAACPGRVTFAGPLPRRGLAVSVRCGALVATYLGLGGLRVRAGARVGRGRRLGTLGSRGRLRLGARRATDRRGYVDPLTLLADPNPAAPPARARRPAPARTHRSRPRCRRSSRRRRRGARPPRRSAGCRGPPTRRSPSSPPRCPSAASSTAAADAPRRPRPPRPPPARDERGGQGAVRARKRLRIGLRRSRSRT